MASKGNLVRSLVCSIACMFIIAFCANQFVPEATAMFSVTGLDLKGGLATDGFFGFDLGNVFICLLHRLIG